MQGSTDKTLDPKKQYRCELPPCLKSSKQCCYFACRAVQKGCFPDPPHRPLSTSRLAVIFSPLKAHLCLCHLPFLLTSHSPHKNTLQAQAAFKNLCDLISLGVSSQMPDAYWVFSIHDRHLHGPCKITLGQHSRKTCFLLQGDPAGAAPKGGCRLLQSATGGQRARRTPPRLL